MPVYAEGRVEHQKRTQTATTLWPFGFVFGVQLGSLEKKKTRRGPVRAALVHVSFIFHNFQTDCHRLFTLDTCTKFVSNFFLGLKIYC